MATLTRDGSEQPNRPQRRRRHELDQVTATGPVSSWEASLKGDERPADQGQALMAANAPAMAANYHSNRKPLPESPRGRRPPRLVHQAEFVHGNWAARWLSRPSEWIPSANSGMPAAVPVRDGLPGASVQGCWTAAAACGRAAVSSAVLRSGQALGSRPGTLDRQRPPRRQPGGPCRETPRRPATGSGPGGGRPRSCEPGSAGRTGG
jgi:hypothetical protein